MPAEAGPALRRAAVLGHPIAHSLSPVLHNAGYAAAGLTGWRYRAIDCGTGGLAGRFAVRNTRRRTQFKKHLVDILRVDSHGHSKSFICPDSISKPRAHAAQG